MVMVVDLEGETASFAVPVTVAEELTVTATANPRTVDSSGLVTLTAVGFDPDDPTGSGLTYMWSSSSVGSFDPPAANQSVVTWTAPSEGGRVEITVTVTNADGEMESDTVSVTVGASPPPPPAASAASAASASALDRAADGERDGVGEDGVRRRRGGADGGGERS